MIDIQALIYQILTLTYLGNELWRIIYFIVILLFTYPIAKISVYIINHYLLKWAKKTSWKFDDVLVESINPPINMFVFAAAFFYGSSYLIQGSYDVFFTRVFNFLMIIPVVYFLIKFLTGILGVYLKGDHKKLHVNTAAVDLLMTITRISLFIIGILLILANLGYNISALLAGLGVGGLAFALAAQDVLKNFFAGVALILDGTFKKGDRIRFQGDIAFINEVKFRSTKLRTLDGTIITAPNSMLSENMVENITEAPKYKVNQVIGVTYGTSLKKLKEAKKIIEDILTKDEDTLEFWVLFDNFGAYSLDIQVIYFMKYTHADWPQRGQAKERINFLMKEKLEKAGLEFAFPTQTLDIPDLKNINFKSKK
jgi:MscS family membrane protein